MRQSASLLLVKRMSKQNNGWSRYALDRVTHLGPLKPAWILGWSRWSKWSRVISNLSNCLYIGREAPPPHRICAYPPSYPKYPDHLDHLDQPSIHAGFSDRGYFLPWTTLDHPRPPPDQVTPNRRKPPRIKKD